MNIRYLLMLCVGCAADYPDPRNATIEVHDERLEPSTSFGLAWWKEATHDISSRVARCNDDQHCVTISFGSLPDNVKGQTINNRSATPFGSQGRSSIIINRNRDWTEADLEHVVPHELGHSMMIGHADDPEDLMYKHGWSQCITNSTFDLWREEYGSSSFKETCK